MAMTGEPTSHLVEDPPLRWHVSRAGRGPVALLLHGAGASSHSFAALVPALAQRFTTIAVDLPGHARTRRQRAFEPSLTNVVARLRRLLDALGLQPELVIGHSVGAAIALQLAHQAGHPRPQVVALAPAFTPLRGFAGAVFRPMAAALRLSIAPDLLAARLATTARIDNMLRALGTGLDADGVERYRALVAQPGHVQGVLDMMSRWDVAPLYESLPRIDVRTLVLAGEGDRAIPLADIRAASQRLANAELDVIAGVGHLVHEERPDLVARAILDFVDAQRRASTDFADRRGANSWPC